MIVRKRRRRSRRHPRSLRSATAAWQTFLEFIRLGRTLPFRDLERRLERFRIDAGVRIDNLKTERGVAGEILRRRAMIGSLGLEP